MAVPVAVIGAGLSGAICAKTLLHSPAFIVSIFEKASTSGGRLKSTRLGDGTAHFDHGAQYFTVRDTKFKQFLDPLIQDKIVEEWKGTLKVQANGQISDPENTLERFVAIPDNSALVKSITDQFEENIVHNCKITALKWNDENEEWSLFSEGKAVGNFRGVVLSCPAPQAAELLKDVHPEFYEKLSTEVEFFPCWALLISFASVQPIAFDGCFVNNSPISWIARNNSKPGRPIEKECWVVHASADWSKTHFDEKPEFVKDYLLKTFKNIVPFSEKHIVESAVHLWRYSVSTRTLNERFLYDCSKCLGICGDWCGGPRVQGAYLSGFALAEKIITVHNNK